MTMVCLTFNRNLTISLAFAFFVVIIKVNGFAVATPMNKHMKIQNGAPPPPPVKDTFSKPYSEMLDMTHALGPKVADFNQQHPDAPIQLLAKAEFRNPASQSHKDRIARAMIAKAEARGELTDSNGNKKTILAASSGNSGHAFAVLGSQMGFNVTIITNRKCSQEKCDNIRKGGAELWIAEELPEQFPNDLEGVKCYMEQERILAQNYPDQYFSVNQYDNTDNLMAHYEATAQEIWEQSQHRVTHFVMAASTGGSIMGCGKNLKEKNHDIHVVLSDPHKSSLAGILEKARGNLVKGEEMLRKVKQTIKEDGSSAQVEGAGKDELTEIMKHDGGVLKYVDEAISVHDFDAFDKCREVARQDGFRIGGSAGMNLVACQRLAERCIDEGKGSNIVLTTLLCDDGNKYKSKIFNDEWIKENDTRNKKTTENIESDPSKMGYHLDPEDWDEYRAQMHDLLNACCDRMQAYREKSWQAPPSDLAQRVRIETADDGHDLGSGTGQPLSEVMDQLTETIMPHATGNTNPQFFGWVHGGGLPSSIAADLVSATMNSNCGGRNQGANHVEVACIDFLTEKAGFATSANKSNGITRTPFGVLTGGTSQATIYALMAARTKQFGYQIRKTGIHGLGAVRVYVSEAAHSCITRAMECLGHGSESVVRIPINPTTGSMEVEELRKRLEEDKAHGVSPLAIVGTAGSVTVGAYDDFNALADLAEEYSTWFHVDAAFGFWTRLSQDPQVRALTNHIDRADSIALDAHKWPGVNYAVGALLVRDKEHLRDTMASRPAYLQSASEGLAGGDTWFTDYSLDLSRGFHALKLWTALKTAGADSIGQVVTDHCALASYMGRLVDASPLLELAHPVLSNVCCFSINQDSTTLSAAEVAAELQRQGKGVFSTIKFGDKDCLRAALVNHRTTEKDVENAITAVEDAVKERTQ